MIVRIFTGDSWSAATHHADAGFEQLPRVGETIASGSDDAWIVGQVVDVVHRVVGGDAADVALLLGRTRSAARGDEPLPLAALDGGNDRPAASPSPSVPRSGPWRR
ncbi:MAG: hypothetical protein JWN59_810 [Sphingomonas bacterium]|nr:hypothetical protein [Sphingomonas bacterium]